jgi:hypothetical protein
MDTCKMLNLNAFETLTSASQSIDRLVCQLFNFICVSCMRLSYWYSLGFIDSFGITPR